MNGADISPDDEPLAIVFEFAEFPSIAGSKFRSAWFRVDDEHRELFDAATYTNQNPYTFDLSFYPDHLVEGMHLLALLDHLQNATLRLKTGTLTGWNYGFDRVRFTNPVRAGEPFRLVGTVVAVEPRNDGYLTSLDCSLEIAGHDKPAMVALWRVLLFQGETSPTSGETPNRT